MSRAGGACLAAAVVFLGGHALLAQGAASLSVNGAQQFQVIDGFGVSANANSWSGGELRPALDLLVDQLGASIWRVVIDNGDWESSNDNADPDIFNWSVYNGIYTTEKFEELWSTLAYLNQKGLSDQVMLSVMGPVAPWMGGSQINAAAEDEWVEMIASLVYYGRVTRGLRFSLLSPLNETDWDGIEGPRVDQWQYVTLLRKLALKLDAIGLPDIQLIGPETAAVGTGVGSYMPELMTDDVVMSKVDHFAFHNYAGDSGGADAAIRNSAYPTRNFWITEVSNIWDVLSHISQGPSATLVWDAYDSVYNHAILAGRGSTPPNDAGNGPALLAYDQGSRTYTPRKAFYEHAQLFRFVRPGARRVGTAVSGAGLTIYAFNDLSSGHLTIVGRNAGTGSRTINGSLANLPSVTSFQFYQTTASTNLLRGPDVVVANNTFSVQVAGGGVFTLTASTTPDTEPPSVTVTSPTGVVSGTVVATATASDNVGVGGVQFEVDGISLGAEDTQAPYQVTWNTTTWSAGPHQLTARARDQAGNVRTSEVVSVVVDNTDSTPPSVGLTSPGNGATVSGTITLAASVSDNVGVARVQFLVDDAPLAAEDTVAPYSVAWTTTSAANGPHTVSARAWDIAGNVATSSPVSVTVSNSTGQPPGLVAAYGFGEGGGSTVADNSGQGHVGTISGAGWSTAGRYGSALSFDGANDRVTVADAAALDLTAGLTIEAWVRPTSHGTWRTVVMKEASGGLAYALYSSTDASLPAGYLRIGGDVGLDGPSSLALNTWTHVAITYDASTLRLFVNGTQVSSRSQTGSVAASASPLSIGGNGVWGEYFAGLIDEVRVYNRALSAAELQADMNTPIAGPGDAVPPQVTLTAPAGEATVSGTVALAATASDNVGVVGVQFLVDGVAVGAEDGAAPYGASWASTAVANGTHVIAARARDAAGNQTTSPGITVTVSNDGTAPTVAVTAPAGGAVVSGTVALAATASDNVGVVGVQFLVDGVAVGAEDGTAPYGASWVSTAVANGSHVITARARDAAGHVADSAAVTVTVANGGPAPTGLVAAYGFDELAGTTAMDASGLGHTGTIAGATWSSAGRFGRALSFDGANAVVTVADAAALNLTNGMTLEAWVRPTVPVPPRTVILMKERPGGLVYALYAANGGGRPTGYVRLGSDVAAAASTALAPNTWTHLAVTFDGSALRLFANGVLVRTTAGAGGIAPSAGPLKIGGNAVWGEFFAGLIDEVRIYNRALSAAELQGDMNTPIAGSGDSTPPQVALTAPATGATVSGVVSLTADASDNVSVTGVQFLVDGVAVGAEDVTAPYAVEWPSASATNGTHVVSARARDAAGLFTDSTAVTVTVANGGPAPAGLVAAYGFDEVAGTTAPDATGLGHTGTLSGPTWSVEGRFGGALSFDGTNDVVTVADVAGLDLTSGMTLEAWVRPTGSVAPRTVVLMKERLGGLVYALYAGNGGARPTGFVRLGGDVAAPAQTPIAPDTWTHLAATFDGAVLRLYVNGVLVRSTAGAGAIATSVSPLKIGGNAVWGEYFAGLIDEVRIYNRPLSQPEIQGDMNTPVSQ
jgi:hypothetical protein